jgi:hypothetical protein
MITNRSGVFKLPKKGSCPRKSLPVVNYASALARALEWLGDRYLLAKPVNSVHRMPVDPGAVTSRPPCSGKTVQQSVLRKNNYLQAQLK